MRLKFGSNLYPVSAGGMHLKRNKAAPAYAKNARRPSVCVGAPGKAVIRGMVGQERG
jgi:hypothetical protein